MSSFVIIAVLATSCARAAGSSDAPGAAVDYIVPSGSMTDWVSYAKQVSLITVVKEERGVAPEGVLTRGEGHVTGLATLRIEENLWVAPGFTPLSGQLQAHSLGWIVHDGEFHTVSPALEPGATYLVPLANFESGISPMRPPAIRVVDGRVTTPSRATRDAYGDWVAGLGGFTIDELRAALAATHPDDVASRYASLTVEAQLQAVKRDRIE